MSDTQFAFFQSFGFREKLSLLLLKNVHCSPVNQVFRNQSLTFEQDKFEIVRLSENSFILKTDEFSNIFFYAVHLSAQKMQIQIDGEILVLSCPRHQVYHGDKENSHHNGEVKAPMAGKIYDVLINKNEEVQIGQVLFILESMKMQLEVKSPTAGQVKEIYVEKGQVLSGPHLLATIE